MRLFYTVLLASIIFACKSNNKKEEKVDDVIEAFVVDTSLPIESPKAKIVYDKLNFGNGYNSANGREYFGVLEYDGVDKSTEISANAKGNTGTIKMDILESKEQLKEAFKVTTKVDLDFKIYGFSSSNSFKNDLYEETEFNDFHQNAVITAEYTNEPLIIINPTVKDEWIELAKNNPDEFMRTCGDMFVSRIFTGGELYAFFSLESHDSSQKKENNTFFETTNSYYGNSLGGSVGIDKVTQSYNKTEKIKTKIFTRGGGSTPSSPTLDSFIKYAGEFKEQVAQDNRAMVLYVELTPYETIAGFPKVNFNKIRVDQTNFIDYGIEKYNELEESLSNAFFVKKETQYFNEYDIATADTIVNTFPEKINNIQVLLKNCESDFDQCNIKDLEAYDGFDVFAPVIDFPELKGIKKELPIEENGNYVKVLDYSENNGKFLTVNGMLESRPRANRASPKCYNPSFKADRKFLKRTRFTDTYVYYEYPYYMVRYKDQSGNVLQSFKWRGNPIKTEKNVTVEMKLVNTKTKLQYFHRKKWHSAGQAREKRVGFKSNTQFTGVRPCNDEVPQVVFANNLTDLEEAKKMKMAANNTQDIEPLKTKPFPKLVERNGYWGYDFDSDSE